MQYIEYIIQPGDTLQGIADKFQTTILSISLLNSIINPDKISAGQILKVAPPGYVNPYSMQKFYRIQKGDTLGRIARQFGTTIEKIIELNNIDKDERLSVGQIIKIP